MLSFLYNNFQCYHTKLNSLAPQQCIERRLPVAVISALATNNQTAINLISGV
ncbi:hypothetical protein J122_1052 [Marinobacter excellens LAMA 842]|uniref:Uncharacterized protein n=1 Tax=Marinobacter excellens LAMA 842 TaxID=1306954 RepID=A0A137SES3_9GAMM|nr:hypothetical protein J122_1052 [Marinobacter excellens LAMA 842]